MNRWRSLILVLVVSLAALFLPGSVGQSLRRAAGWVMRPVTSGLQSAAIWLDTRVDNLVHLGQLHSERTQLQEKVIELENQVAALSGAAHENELLRGELAVRERTAGWQRIQATVISRAANNANGQIIIDQGSTAGVAVGQAVISQGMLVGKVSDASPSSATVTLVTSPLAQIQAELVDNQALGLVAGSSTGLRLTEIDQGVPLQTGMLVQTSGITLGGMMPRGLVIGQVDRIVSEPNASSQSAIIHSPIDFDRLRLVFVILPQ